jgi:type I restriction enzyme S subunit
MKLTWPTKKLREICIENVKSPFKVEDASNSGEYPFFTSGEKVLTHDKYLVDGENIFLATGGYATVKYYNGKASYSTDTWSLKVKDVLTKFVYYQILVRLKYIDEVLFRGSGLRHLQKREFLDLEIPIPPLPIQQKIVKILDTIQEAIDIHDKIIEKTKELKKSLMAELFKYGAPSFRKGRKLKKTEIGEIPEDWEVVRLGEYFEFKNGINFKKEQKGKGTLVLDVLNMYTDSLYPNLNEIYRVEGSFSEEYYLKQGDILFVRSSLKQEGVGWCAVFPGFSEPVLFCGFLIRAKPKTEKTDSNFFVYLFRTENFRNQIISQSGVVTITNLSQSILSNLLILLPPLPEQQEIAEILQTVDQKIEIERRKKELYEELFKTMLNKIMNQEIDIKLLNY